MHDDVDRVQRVRGGERFGGKGQKGSGYQMLEQHLHPAKVCTTEAAGRRCFASPILSQKENARRDRIEFTLHEKAWGGRRKSCSFDMRVPFGCCSRLHLTNPTGSSTIYRSHCLFFFFFLLFICKMKQASLKGDRAFAAWHSRGLVIILGRSRRVMLWTNLDDARAKT